MEDISQKALSLLIHDIRTPLSVAQGYVRLIREDSLTGSQERERALAQTAEALGRIGRCCTDASDLAALAETEGPCTGSAPLSAVVESLLTEAATWQLEMQIADLADVAVATSDPRQLGAALLGVVSTRRAGPPGRVLAIDRNRFLLLGLPEQIAPLRAGPESPTAAALDPWTGGHGLQLPLATLRLHHHHTRIWTMRSTPGTLGVQFPVAASS